MLHYKIAMKIWARCNLCINLRISKCHAFLWIRIAHRWNIQLNTNRISPKTILTLPTLCSYNLVSFSSRSIKTKNITAPFTFRSRVATCPAKNSRNPRHGAFRANFSKQNASAKFTLKPVAIQETLAAAAAVASVSWISRNTLMFLWSCKRDQKNDETRARTARERSASIALVSPITVWPSARAFSPASLCRRFPSQRKLGRFEGCREYGSILRF